MATDPPQGNKANRVKTRSFAIGSTTKHPPSKIASNHRALLFPLQALLGDLVAPINNYTSVHCVMGATVASSKSKRSLASKGMSVLIFGGLVFGTAIWLLFIAAGVYATVYHFYIPQSEVRSAVYFHHDVRHKNYSLCVIDLVHLPFSHVDYSLNLALEMQRSDRNKQIGNFGITVTLADEKTVDSAIDGASSIAIETRMKVRSGSTTMLTGILPYRSPLLESLNTLTFAPLYVFGLIKQTSTMDLRLFDQIRSLKRNYKYAVVHIKGRIDLENASLIWKPQLRGVRYLMSQYQLLSFFFGTLLVWFWELSATLGTILIIRSRNAQANERSDKLTSHEIQIPRRSVSRRHYKSLNPPSEYFFEYSDHYKADTGSPLEPLTTGPVDANINREHTRETTQAQEFEESHSQEDTPNVSYASDTVEAETPATTIDDFESLINQSTMQDTSRAGSSSFSALKPGQPRNRKG